MASFSPSDDIGVLWQIAGWTRASLAKSHFALLIKTTPEETKKSYPDRRQNMPKYLIVGHFSPGSILVLPV